MPNKLESEKKIATAQKKLRAEYGELFDFLVALLSLYDPMCLNFDASTSEYKPEAIKILPRLRKCRSVAEVQGMVHLVFTKAFGRESAGAEEDYEKMSVKIWELWEKSNIPGRKSQ